MEKHCLYLVFVLALSTGACSAKCSFPTGCLSAEGCGAFGSCFYDAAALANAEPAARTIACPDPFAASGFNVESRHGLINHECDSLAWRASNAFARSISGATLIFDSGPLAKNVKWYGANILHIPGVHFANCRSTLFFDSIDASKADKPQLYLDHIEMTGADAVGVFVDVRKYKRFVVRRETVGANAGRLCVRCYDAKGNIMTPGDADLIASETSEFKWKDGDAAYGGHYRQSSDDDKDIFFAVANAAYVDVMMSGGSVPIKLKSFSIFSVDGGSPATWTGFEGKVVDDVMFGKLKLLA